MKRQSQKSIIFSFLFRHSNLRPIEISSILKIPRASVRRALTELRKEDKIERSNPFGTARRIRKLKVKTKKIIKKLFRRKIAKGTQYCENKGTLHKGKKEMIFAITYETNKIDRFAELIDEIESSSISLSCHTIEDSFGYDDQKLVKIPPFTYPEIRVESEI